MNTLFSIAASFQIAGEILDIQPFGSGNVHDTYLVTLKTPATVKYILQKINRTVFPEPERIVGNCEIYTLHVIKKIQQEKSHRTLRWELPGLIKTHNDHPLLQDKARDCWRLMTFIDGTRTFQRIESSWQAYETGFALGRFHSLVSDLDPLSMYDTLPGFHITTRYLADYDRVLQTGYKPQSREQKYCTQFIENRRRSAALLEEAKHSGLLSNRIIHGDPKINNILFAKDAKRAVGMIDLDTVKPGLLLYDLGDCLRSSCNPSGEETTHPEEVRFDLETAAEVLKGYFSQQTPFFTQPDQNLIFEAVRLLAFELGLRFFADFLAGNLYFKTSHSEHNLVRALVQFKLVESIESNEPAIRNLIPQSNPTV